MSRKVRIKVMATLDNRPVETTLVIDRDTQVISVRPFRRRRTYDLTLAWVARAIYRKVVMTEVAEKKATKKQAKKNTVKRRR